MADKGQRPDDHRRKWDLSEYEKAAKMREDVEKAMNRLEHHPPLPFQFSSMDLTSLREFVITLVIIEINGANFAPIIF